ncbi:glycosyltransferase family 4 protein [Roseovarius sp.]|uniref:glycosyltransferase family 4 protein n=1 Tax=Roseovarius sp. TaxID=1486281 RepID=UPI003562FCD9
MLVWNTFRHDARVRSEAETLAQAGYRVVIHALHAPGITERQETFASGIMIVRHGRMPGKRQSQPRGAAARRSWLGILGMIFASLLTQFAIIFAIVRSRPRVVHAHDVNMLAAGWLAASLLRVPLVYDAHEVSTDREGYGAIRGAVAALEKRIMPRAAGTITTTDARAKFFARAYRITRPLVLQNRPRSWRGGASTRIRDELRLENNWPIVLYQGGLQPGRGLEDLVHAATEIPRAYFVFVGGGSLYKALTGLTGELGLDSRVKFIDTVPLADLPWYTASADIGVQPIENTCLNHFTTDSNKLFEYVMAGLPVVASRLPEICKMVQAHELGLLVSPGDREELIEALRRFVSDSDLRAHYAANARKAAKMLNWESQEQALLELYDSILHRKR